MISESNKNTSCYDTYMDLYRKEVISMGGFFGVVSKQSCTLDLFFGVDYHSHLGTRRGAWLYMKKEGLCQIHSQY